MSTTLDAGGGMEVLDLLFNDEGILAPSVGKTTTVDIPNMTLDDLNTDLLNFLNDGTLNDNTLDMAEIAESHIKESQQKLLDSAAEADHQYCTRNNSTSDSGVGSDASMSPGHLSMFSDNVSVTDIDSSSVFSGDKSPAQYEDVSQGSPLGGNIEDLQLGDLNFDGLDPSLLNEEFLQSLNNITSDIALDLKYDDDDDDDIDVPVKKQKLTKIEDDDLDHIDIMDNDSMSGLPFHIQDVVKDKSKLQELSLSDEEKTLLRREGYAIPTHLPLTKKKKVPTATLR